ncbi:MAG: STAS domain-containing protein [Chloroflexia bacterium]
MAEQMNTMVGAGLGDAMQRGQIQAIQAMLENLGRPEETHIEDIAVFATREEPVGPGGVYRRSVLVYFVSGFPGRRAIPRQELEKEQASAACWGCHQLPPEQRPVAIPVDLAGSPVLRSVQPLKNEAACQRCHGTEERIIGVSLVDFSLEHFRGIATPVRVVLAAGGGMVILLIVAALYLLLNRLVLRPLRALVPLTRAVTQGDWEQRVPVYGADEIGQLGTAFNEMTAQLARTYADLQRARAEQEERSAALRQALEDVERGREEQARLMETVRALSTPVVPVRRGVLVMPLVGVIDQARAQHITAALLEAVERERARFVILDITGVPVVDTAVAQALIEAAQAARLLGAEPVLVGISPPVAETIVSLGVDLSALVTRADLQSGVEYALGRMGTSGSGGIGGGK